MLFSLFSLNSLYSLLLGIVFDTHEGRGLPFVCVVPFYCWVSFSIPMTAWGGLSCLVGIVFDTHESVRVYVDMSPLLLGIVFDTREGCVEGGVY